ncbi:MAG: hypothetical protein WCD57_24810, partial [Acidobacteriaceae bacterium]
VEGGLIRRCLSGPTSLPKSIQRSALMKLLIKILSAFRRNIRDLRRLQKTVAFRAYERVCCIQPAELLQRPSRAFALIL